MSFSEDVRNELAAIAPERECDRQAELSALFHSAGRWHMRGGEVSVHLDVSSSAVARRAFSLLRSLGVYSEIRTYRRRSFDRATRYQLHIEGTEQALEVLQACGVLGRRRQPLSLPPKRIVGRRCCRAAYLRGSLLAAGSVSPPPSPHLEVRTESKDAAEFVADAVAREDVTLRVLERRDHAAAYAKGLEPIAEALALAGASDAALALDEGAVVGETKARANRLTNADHANLIRTSRAAHAQLEAIRRLERDEGFDRLSPRLREVAELRLRHPSLPLRELALKCRPPASKAAVHRRLQRLISLAEI
ncbi:MAG TPA: DNA-binding protein WhiA [Gaiellaceae bacterium]|jgi:DNA-binding protein WhiA|nr:DNA-binding protein WhiA [Gaiellaceae bacterium]